MPYNNTPISPPEEYNGTNYLPLARVQKIINADEQIENCSKNAAFAIAIAAEEFIWHLVQQTQNVSKSERRGRNKANLQYKDIANAIARHDNLEFLTDAVPKTISFSKYKDLKREGKNKGVAIDASAAVPVNGQRTLENMGQQPLATNGVDHDVEMQDAGQAGPSHGRNASGSYVNGTVPGSSHTAASGDRPPTSDGTGHPAVFDVVRNGFQAGPDASVQPE